MQLDFTNKLAHINLDAVDGRKVIVKTWGKDFGWTSDDAIKVIAMHKLYINNLNSIGIKTSRNIAEKVIQGDDDEYLIQSIEEYFPQGDLLAQITGSNGTIQFLAAAEAQLKLLIALLVSIPPLNQNAYSVNHLWLSVPIDLKPQNAVISNLQLVVVDTFRPQLWKSNSAELQPMPSPYPEKQRIPHDEIKTGDVRFQAGRLFGYYVAIATRWYMNQDATASITELDAFRREINLKILGLLDSFLSENTLFPQDIVRLLISDVHEMCNESVAIGDFEGPRYVQALYETEEHERLCKS